MAQAYHFVYQHIQFTLQYLRDRGLHLQIRLIWVKVTVKGEPVHSWDNYSRRPYELCMIGGREPVDEVHQCVYIAPANGHSRKPDLSDWIERQDWQAGRKAELFARDIKREWHCFGNEVLKYAATMADDLT